MPKKGKDKQKNNKTQYKMYKTKEGVSLGGSDP